MRVDVKSVLTWGIQQIKLVAWLTVLALIDALNDDLSRNPQAFPVKNKIRKNFDRRPTLEDHKIQGTCIY